MKTVDKQTGDPLTHAQPATVEDFRRAFAQQMEPTENIAWDMYFSGLVAFQLHPGNHLRPHEIDIEPYARLADRMLEARRRRYPWHG